MTLLSYHNQAFAKALVNGLEVDGLVAADPIVVTEPDGATTQPGLNGAQTSVSSDGTGTIEIKVFAYSLFRAWAKKQKLLQRTGNHVPFMVTLLTSAGESYIATGCAIVSAGGATTGGSEGAEHSVMITCENLEPIL